MARSDDRYHVDPDLPPEAGDDPPEPSPVGDSTAHDDAALAEPMCWAVDGLVPCNSQIIVAGSGKIGKKTLVTQHLAKCVSRGEPFLGFQTFRRPVVYLHLEGGQKRARRRWAAFGYGREPVDTLSPLERSAIVTRYDLDGYRRTMEQLRHQELLVIVDSVTRVTAKNGLDQNDANDVTNFLAEHEVLLDESPGSSIVWLHHFRKSRDTMRGSTAWENGSDGWWESHATEDDDVIRLEMTFRDGPSKVIGARFVVQADGTFAFELCDAKKRKIDAKENGDGKRERASRSRNGVRYQSDIDRVREALAKAGDGTFGRDAIVELTRGENHAPLPRRRVDAALEVLGERGEVARGAYGRYEATEALRLLMKRRGVVAEGEPEDGDEPPV